MVVAPLPPNEDERLRSLRSYQILDSDFEKDYNDLCGLAARLCDTPIALISLIDRDRQWFKAVVGLDVRETPREFAFCSHALWQHNLTEVVDAAHDERFHDNPLVTGKPEIRFYAGQPLLTPEGLPLGTLCVIDRVPRTLDEGQKEALNILSRQVMTQLELRRVALDLERSNREKEQFLGIIAHDLRSPLAGVGSLSAYLADEAARLPTADIIEVTTALHQSVLVVQNLAENLLSWALLEQGAMVMRPERLEVEGLVSTVLEPFALPAGQKSLRFVTAIEPGLSLWGDRAMVETALRNLVSNAAKFSWPGQDITVRGGLQGSEIELSVEDHGAGMAPEVLDEVLRSLRAPSKMGTAGERGSGLGLSLVRQFVARHQGRLELESVQGKGTVGRLLFPAREEPRVTSS